VKVASSAEITLQKKIHRLALVRRTKIEQMSAAAAAVPLNFHCTRKQPAGRRRSDAEQAAVSAYGAFQVDRPGRGDSVEGRHAELRRQEKGEEGRQNKWYRATEIPCGSGAVEEKKSIGKR
jgi:hypothetical protein